MTDDYDEFTKRMTSFDLSLGEDIKMEHEDENFYLKHHGIKGMKWGVRKDRGGRIGIRRTRFQPAEEAKATLKKRKRATSEAESLSNEELQKRIKRMELEKRYSDLTTKKHEGLIAETGGRVVKDVLYEVSKDLAKNIVVSAVKRR